MADISQLSDGVTTWDIKDATARSSIANAITTAGTGLSKSGNTLNHSNSVTAGTIGQSSATSGSTLAVPYATYDAQGHITGKGAHTHTITGFVPQNNYGTGSWAYPIIPLVAKVRANRLFGLPADQIIIEKTIDGGVTWEDAGISDSVKVSLFTTPSSVTIPLPLLNNARSELCGVRITITAMKYNVPSGTTETGKYAYWNSSYVLSQERYCSLQNMWFYLNAQSDRLRVQVHSATGANPNTWTSRFDTNFGLSGWSGTDWIGGFNTVFGGGTSQTGQAWNWRITFWSRMQDNATAFTGTSAQAIHQIWAYGENCWAASNTMMQADHLYSWDYLQNATFPNRVTAESFNGGGPRYWGTCGTAAGTAAKTVSISNFKLVPGATISVYMSTDNTVTGAITLNVTSTGAKAVYKQGANTGTGNSLVWHVGDILTFCYTGDRWEVIGNTSAIYAERTRLTSPDLAFGGGQMKHILATSTMTTHKPEDDGHILHMAWDSSTAYWSQFYLPNTGSYAPSWRANSTSMAWDKFYTHAFPPAFSEITGTATSSQIPILSADKIVPQGLLYFSPDSLSSTAGGTIIPYLYNDLAHLVARGGSISVTLDGAAITLTDQNFAFDGSPQWASYNTSGATSLVIEITLAQTYNYANVPYIIFGGSSTRASGVKIDSHNSDDADDVWTERYNVSGSALVSHYVKFSVSSKQLSKLRFTLTGLPTGSLRILEIGLVNYNTIGARWPFMSRGIDDEVFRSITPATASTYSLGSAAKPWAHVYANRLTGNTSWYGTCTTSASTAAKVVTCSGFVLATGARISVLFQYVMQTVTSAWTLNVNGTGAKTVYKDGKVTANGNSVCWGMANQVASFIYNGTGWEFVGITGMLFGPETEPTSLNDMAQMRGNSLTHVAGFNDTTTGHPDGTGHILSMTAKNSNYYGAQLYVPNNSTNIPQWRANANGTWTSWDKFFTQNHPVIATASTIGGVKPDGQSIIVSNDGTITATPAAVGMTCTERKGGVSLDDYNLEAGGGSSWPSDGGWGWREEVWNDGRLTVYYWKWFATTGSGWQRLWTNMPYPTDATPFVDTPFPTATIMDNGAQVEGASMVNLTSLRSTSNTTGFKILYYNLSSNSSSKKLVLVKLDGHWWKEGGSDPDDPTPAEQWAVGDAITIGGNSYYPVTEWKVSDSGAGGDSRLKAAVRFLITTSSTSGAWHVYAQYAAWTDTGYVPTSSQNGYMLIRKLNSQITTYTNDAGVKAKGDVWSALNTNQRQGYVYNAVVEGHLIWGDTPYIITDCGTFTNGQTVSSKTFYVGTTEVSGGVYTQTSVSDTTTTPTSN